MALPHDYNARKGIPLYDFLTKYFPDAIVELVKVSVEGNKQHNPGEPLHWAREKSTDQLNTAMRHIFDHGGGARYDVDGTMHLAKAAWRLLAEIQLIREKEQATIKPGTMTSGGALAGGVVLPHIPQCQCGTCVSVRRGTPRQVVREGGPVVRSGNEI